MRTKQISFAVQGMECANYAVKAEALLAQQEGVFAAQVNYASGRASVVYDPARFHTATIISAVRAAGLDTPLKSVTLDIRDLTYASSGGTVERFLRRAEGVAGASIDLRARRAVVTAFPERATLNYLQTELAPLGFHQGTSSKSNLAAGFVARALVLLAITILAALALDKPLGIAHFGSDILPPFWAIMLASIGLLGTGYPFHRRALAAFICGEFDSSVLISFLSFAAILAGLMLTLQIGRAHV